MTRELLKSLLEDFVERFETATEAHKRSVHYQSTLNITRQLLIMYHNKKAEENRQLMIQYFQEIEKIQLPIGRLESLNLFEDYLMKTGQFLIYERGFAFVQGSNTINIVVGLILDAVLFYFMKDHVPIYVPIVTMVLLIYAKFRKRALIKGQKCFGLEY
ncbi:MAG: hypothetical protein AAF466_03185 [Bacteroidota bacterium]